MKKVFKTLIIAFVFIFLTGCNTQEKDNKLTILSTSFPGYDFARAITKDSDVSVKMLLSPGTEMHHYEPTPKDIINIQKSDIFIYIGGDSDEWIKDVLNNIDTKKTKIIKLMDLVNLDTEEIIDGMENKNKSKEYDEHVWTSPINTINIIDKLKTEIIKIDSGNRELYEKNANNYITEISNIDSEIRDIVKYSKRKEIIFGDRFPIQYFAKEYGLTYYAAFPGCSEQTEASAKTIAFLIDKVKKDKIPVIFHIELSNSKIADEISNETKAKVLEFNTAHNITQNDFESGITYVDIMKKNIKVLKEALN